MRGLELAGGFIQVISSAAPSPGAAKAAIRFVGAAFLSEVGPSLPLPHKLLMRPGNGGLSGRSER